MENSFNGKIKLDRSSVPVILWNLIPFAGVIFLKWAPISVFVFYALETVVVGVFNVFKLLVVYRSGLPPKPGETGVSGLGIIPFFIVHYYFFVFVQLSIFSESSNMAGHSWGPFATISNFFTLVNNSSGYVAFTAFVVNNTFQFINDFIIPGVYTRRTMAEQMFEPYPRIFVQQFVVILGSFIYALTGSGMPVLIIFIIVKIYCDLLLKGFDLATWAQMQKQKVENKA